MAILRSEVVGPPCSHGGLMLAPRDYTGGRRIRLLDFEQRRRSSGEFQADRAINLPRRLGFGDRAARLIEAPDAQLALQAGRFELEVASAAEVLVDDDNGRRAILALGRVDADVVPRTGAGDKLLAEAAADAIVI